MPKIARTIERSVFYLFRKDPKTAAITGPHGTGVLIARESGQLAGELHYYAVTNKHVACALGASIIRLNTADGGTRFIDLGPEDWEFLPEGDDIAAADLDYRLRPGHDQVTHNNEDGFVSKAAIDGFEIGPGEDVFMCGLFSSHHGGDRNVPSVRFGNLSVLANDAAPIELETGARLPSHVVDMRSRSGYSGSPVFVYRVPSSDLTTIPEDWNMAQRGEGIFQIGRRNDHFLGFLGLHCGQFWDPVEVRVRRQKKRAERAGDPIKEGDRLLIQSGMTIVAPAWRITDLLNLEVFEMARKKRDDEREEQWLRRPRAESVEPDTDTDANPDHLQDFKRLVDIAAKKKEKD